MSRVDSEVLADFINRSSEAICKRWLSCVREQISKAREFSDVVVIDSLTKYLSEVADCLRDKESEQFRADSLATAREHGETRIPMGYDVGQVALEYSLLRETIVHAATELGPIPTDVQIQLNRINDIGLINAVEAFLEVSVLRKQREAKSAAEHERENFQKLFKQTPEMVCILDGPEHRFVFTNNAHIKVLGFDALGQTVRDAQPESVEIHGILDDVYRTGRTAELFEIPITVTDRLRYFNLTYAARTNLENVIDGVMILGTEVTEEVLGRETLKLQHRALELAMSNAPLAQILTVMTEIVELQAGGSLIASVLLADRDAKHLHHGAAPNLPQEYNDLVDGIPIGDNIGSCGTAAFRKANVVIKDIANDPAWADYKDLALKFNLRACWSVPMLSSQGQLLGTFAFYASTPRAPTDYELTIIAVAAQTTALIIERTKEMSERKEAAAEAERANTAKSAFLANMSHEIRTPLGAIMGFSGLASQSGTSPENINSYLGVIERNSHQVLRIIDDILDLAKVEAGKVELEDVAISLTELLADFSSLMGFRARENGIGFKIKAETDLPDPIITDPTRLRQILTNAVGNAIKFTQKGLVTLSVGFSRGMLKFAIEDTGRGISPDQAQNLFQAFVQADVSTTRKFGGTGLGLVLTKRLCQLMGGDYELIRSELGVGSAFCATIRIRLPADAQIVPQQEVVFESAVEKVVVAPKARLDGARVLLVEDSPDNQVLIRLLLEREGVKLEIASDGIEGVEKALSGNFDLVLMDIQMPLMDGHEAVQTLRQKGYTRPVVALTAHAMKEEAERARASGFTSFLSKPIQREELISTVGTYAQSEPTP